MDNKTRFFIILPLALILVFIFAAIHIPFESGMSETEMRISDIKYNDLEIKKKQDIQTMRAATSPLVFNLPGTVNDLTGETGSTPQNEFNNINVSLIVISGKNKMAIIRGEPVKEGDYIDDKRVVKIEPDRVLLKNKRVRWIYVEK